MRIVLLGAPGSGKGTQAAILREKLAIPHISTGDLLRAAVRDGTEIGKQAESIMAGGNLVPDDMILGLLKERLQQDDIANGYILDGYPRNLAQAEALDQLLDELGLPVQEAIQIDVDTDQVVERIARRAELEGRADDDVETVRHRMTVYENETAPVIDYYANRELLSQILGTGSIEEVSARLLSVLQGQMNVDNQSQSSGS